MHKSGKIGQVIVICFWVFLIGILLAHRDEITVEKIVGFSPDNTLMAIFVMLALFALKGSTVFMSGNILYTACGVMFSLPLAIAVNILGSIIMTTIPFGIGRKGGAGILEKLTRKYKKLYLLQKAPKENEFLFALFLRILGLLPCEPVGMFLGACKLHYPPYIGGTLLGLLPAVITYAVMGEYASIPSSPQFIAAAMFQIATTVCTLIVGCVWQRKRKTNYERSSVCSK